LVSGDDDGDDDADEDDEIVIDGSYFFGTFAGDGSDESVGELLPVPFPDNLSFVAKMPSKTPSVKP